MSVAIIILLSGCTALSSLDKLVPDNTKKYRQAKALPPLEVPPDLSTAAIHDDIKNDNSSTATYLEYQEQVHNPLMDIYGVKPDLKPHIEGEGEQRRLVVPGIRKKVWEQVRNFWLENGLQIKAEDIRIGFMDAIGSSEQDSYRVRIEEGKTPQSTIVSLKQHIANTNPRQEDMVFRRLAEYLGALHAQNLAENKQQSNQQTDDINGVSIVDEGTALQVEQDFSRVWRRIGLVLERKGFAIEDKNRSRGVYYIRYDDPFTHQEEKDSSWLSKLAFWDHKADKSDKNQNRYQIKLISDGSATRIVVLNAKGRRDRSEVAKQLVSLLGEQLTEP
ncbi:NlpB/DapX lipoprotein [Candidatus Nitrosoglobus terrae]|uniref:NlpB/DapX lipoprotein n=1 Tax=Candidatus Nitrosoglobus terrae TaxID=1630141 RepID=A0A1Q2SP72_9GAMM|nr:outer membrane protein assembly factor BamC [Candidatus Nitrosoglobus terrae]BAW80903.1 NlpB/DapX lipoprotein [Candidatus Nitrosoglobus terrae]